MQASHWSVTFINHKACAPFLAISGDSSHFQLKKQNNFLYQMSACARSPINMYNTSLSAWFNQSTTIYAAWLCSTPGRVLVTGHNSEQILLLPMAEAVQEGGFFDLSTFKGGCLAVDPNRNCILLPHSGVILHNWTSLSLPKQSCFVTQLLGNIQLLKLAIKAIMWGVWAVF